MHDQSGVKMQRHWARLVEKEAHYTVEGLQVRQNCIESFLSKAVYGAYPSFNWCCRILARCRPGKKPRTFPSTQGARSNSIQPGRPSRACTQLTQLTLDAGQRDFGRTTCPSCGMVYVPGNVTDEAAHKRYHNAPINSMRFGGWAKERVISHEAGGRVLMVLPNDPAAHLNKVSELLRGMEQAMGWDDGWLQQPMTHPDTKEFTQRQLYLLFITSAKQVGAMLVADYIISARCINVSSVDDTCSAGQQASNAGSQSHRLVDKVVPNSQGEIAQPPLMTETLQGTQHVVRHAVDTAAETACLPSGDKTATQITLVDRQNLHISKSDSQARCREEHVQNIRYTEAVLTRRTASLSVPAILGIRGLWVSPMIRRQGVGLRLINLARCHFTPGFFIPASQTGFAAMPLLDEHAFHFAVAFARQCLQVDLSSPVARRKLLVYDV